jgi:hypothetical protein
MYLLTPPEAKDAFLDHALDTNSIWFYSGTEWVLISKGLYIRG